MINFLHTNLPDPVIISLGGWAIHWYGALIVLGMIAGIAVAMKLAPKYGVNKETVIDLAFWLIIFGIAGARLYHVGLEASYYLDRPWEIPMLWQGGLAIHGAIAAGVVVLWVYSRRQHISFWVLSGLLVPGLALAQAIGRWGNYFNQEVFGYPTELPWGIPISFANRLPAYMLDTHFHPTFLYESLGNLAIFALLLLAHHYVRTKPDLDTKKLALVTLAYIFLYSLLRYTMEFFRVDQTLNIWGLRFPQAVSLILMTLVLGVWIWLKLRTNSASCKGLEKNPKR
jgi:phosphatidylglycerol:prolipoprotein diacylglycerol transferase